jgi:glucokinase
VVAVGIGIPGLLDARTGQAAMSTHLPIAGTPFGALVAERIGLPVQVDNDANLAMLAEHRAGAARGTSTAVMLTLGTGIGGGLVIGGELFRGAIGAGAELGHIVVDFDGPPCHGNCPGHGCLEVYASGTALAREGLRAARSRPDSALGWALDDGQPITGTFVTELALAGDAAAIAAVTRLGERLGVGLVSLVNIFNPEVIVIGGGVIAAGELLLAPARAVVAARALPPSRDLVRVVAAHFGADAGLLGAALLAREGAGAPAGARR